MTAQAAADGVFRIGGEIAVSRLGFGALRITGPGNWGDPLDRAAALALLRRVPELGINLIDTADSYGPETSEQLIREALHPYPEGLVIATKGALVRPRPETWAPLGRPEYLFYTARLSARRLGLDTLPLWQLHRIDPKVPRDEQFDAIRVMRDEGLVRHVGLSEVGVEEIEAARAYFPVATVQNLYNLADRRSEAVLSYCQTHGIGFIPYFPLAAGRLADTGLFSAMSRRHAATLSQLALAWLLRKSDVILPIPGTSQVCHLEENVESSRISLSQLEFDQLDGFAH